jgi:hypothetical protein
VKVTVERLSCYRCGYKWWPKIALDGTIIIPRTCANKKCKSPYWFKPRLTKPSEIIADEFLSHGNPKKVMIGGRVARDWHNLYHRKVTKANTKRKPKQQQSTPDYPLK